jgi:hypothetical protein
MLHHLISLCLFFFTSGPTTVVGLIGFSSKPASIFQKSVVVSQAGGPGDQVAEINVRYKLSYLLRYDPCLDRYVTVDGHNNESPQKLKFSTTSKHPTHYPFLQASTKLKQHLVPFFKSSFLPEGVSNNYYSFMKWRALQRFISANLHVLTTQSLLLGLGLKNRSAALGVSAAVNWVLKDALGKISRMVWGMCILRMQFYTMLFICFLNASSTYGVIFSHLCQNHDLCSIQFSLSSIQCQPHKWDENLILMPNGGASDLPCSLPLLTI